MPKTLLARVARGLHKGTILNITPLSFYYHMINNFVPERKHIPFLCLPYMTLFLLPTERAPPRPTITSDRALRAMPRLLTAAAYETNGQVRERKG